MLSRPRGIDHESMAPSRHNRFPIREFSIPRGHSCAAGLSEIYRSILRGEGRVGKGCGKSGRGQAGDLVC